MLQDLSDTSNNLFRNLTNKSESTEKDLKYFSIDFKKPPAWGSYFCCSRFTSFCLKFQVGQSFETVLLLQRNVSEFLGTDLKLVMQ